MNPSPPPQSDPMVMHLPDATLVAPYAHLFLPLPEDEFAALRAGIQADGICEPVLLDRCVVLDGYSRLLIAADLAIPLAQIPVLQAADYFGDGDDLDGVIVLDAAPDLQVVLSEAERLGFALATHPGTRRRSGTDLTLCGAEAVALRGARLIVVRMHRIFGRSVREIAQLERVSGAQIQRDLKDIEASDPRWLSRCPRRVRGRDGRSYPATPARNPVAEAGLTVPPDPTALREGFLRLGQQFADLSAALVAGCEGDAPQVSDAAWVEGQRQALEAALVAALADLGRAGGAPAMAPPQGDRRSRAAWVAALRAHADTLKGLGRDLRAVAKLKDLAEARRGIDRILTALTQVVLGLRCAMPKEDIAA